MRVLVAFLLAVLGSSLAEGRLLSKCDLKKAFDNQIYSDKLQRLDLNFMAKIVYYVEKKSDFNTSAVTHEAEDHSSERRHAKDDATVWPHSEEVPTFYGLFQLSNLLACSDGTTPSPDICSMDCNNFTDDDISDDLKCLLKVHAAFIKNAFGGPHSEKLQQWYMRILRECGNKSSDYLRECVP